MDLRHLTPHVFFASPHLRIYVVNLSLECHHKTDASEKCTAPVRQEPPGVKKTTAVGDGETLATFQLFVAIVFW